MLVPSFFLAILPSFFGIPSVPSATPSPTIFPVPSIPPTDTSHHNRFLTHRRHHARAVTSTWSALGCATDAPSRALTATSTITSQNSIEFCENFCAAAGYTYAGVEYGQECYCGNSLMNSLGVTAPSTDCSMSCAGNSAETCGGSYRLNLFKLAAVPTTTAATWTALGCATDAPARALTATSTVTSQNSVEICERFCAAAGYSYAGVEYGQECYCGNALMNGLGASAPSSDCNNACSGNSGEICGGSYRLNLYSRISPSSAPTSTASPTINGWAALGCAMDGGSRALTATSTVTSGNSVEFCESFCSTAGYTYAGVEYGQECYCGNALSNGLGQAAPASDCNYPCPANGAEICGGSYRLNLYSRVSSSTPTPTPTPTPTASWSAIGCVTDVQARALTASMSPAQGQNSVEVCEDLCAAAGYVYAGVEYGFQCFCGNALVNGGGAAAPSGDCNSPCPGNSAETCGGSYRMNLYSHAVSSTPTPTPTTSWSSLGCVTDVPARALTASMSPAQGQNSVEVCEGLCAAAGYVYAGVEYGFQCFCGNALVNGGGGSAPSTDCNSPCPGNSAEMCGGGYRFNLYSRVGVTVTTSATTTSISTTSTTTPSTTTTTTSAASTPISSSRDVIVQMFEWTWDSVAAECTQFLGPAGYGYVQVSPAQEHIQGTQWWTDYQPVSHTIISKRGSRAQYQNMIQTCGTAGVQVIADTIFNHMSAISSGTGVGGTSFTHWSYPPLYTSEDFHYCGLEPNNDIVNYDNRLEVQTCQLDDLADLDTGAEYVRETLAAYGNDLLSLGAAGLRLDAAKHISATDLGNITSRLNGQPFLTQEVIWGSGEPIQPSEYVGIGYVQEFRYTTALQNAFLSSGISSLQRIASQGWVDSSVANVFVADHDTERNGNSLNYQSPSNTYTLAHVFMLSWPFGVPTVLSSYMYNTTDDGAPNNGVGTCYGAGGTSSWLCQHRWTAIAGLTMFHNSVSGGVTNFVSNTNQQIAYARGTTGFVAINNADSAWSMTFATGLTNGIYCDAVSGSLNGNSCTGSSYTISGGCLTTTLFARSALAVYTSAVVPGSASSVSGSGNCTAMPSSSVVITFIENETTTYGDNVYLVGSISQLGNWNANSAIALSSANYPNWSVTMNLPPNTSFQYKFIVISCSGSVTWESDPNRQYTTPSTGVATISSTWR